MSSPDPRAHDRSDMQYGEEPSSFKKSGKGMFKGQPSKQEPSSAKGRALKVKAFGSEHNPKAFKRMMKKGEKYRIKHF
jgi:hypothetical protein